MNPDAHKTTKTAGAEKMARSSNVRGIFLLVVFLATSLHRHLPPFPVLRGKASPNTIPDNPDAWRFESILWRFDHRAEISTANAGEPIRLMTIGPRQNAVSRRVQNGVAGA